MTKQSSSLGTKIRNARISHNLSQQDIAQKTGLNVSHYAKIERDEINPTIKTLEKIANVLKIKLSDLL
jgi:transcriptional regulator with XRE-family HTH domain